MQREIFERGRTVGVLLYDPAADALVLVEQFRLAPHLAGFPGWQTEIVAGIVDPWRRLRGDRGAARNAARRPGVAIEGQLLPIHRFMPSPGGSTETVDLFCGRVDAGGAGGSHGLADEHEDIKVLVLSYREAMRRLRADAIINSPTIIALYWLAAHRARLRRAWSERSPASGPAHAPEALSRCDEGAGRRMMRRSGAQAPDVERLDEAPVLHHRDPVHQRRHYREVVAHQEIGDAALAPQAVAAARSARPAPARRARLLARRAAGGAATA